MLALENLAYFLGITSALYIVAELIYKLTRNILNATNNKGARDK